MQNCVGAACAAYPTARSMVPKSITSFFISPDSLSLLPFVKRQARRMPKGGPQVDGADFATFLRRAIACAAQPPPSHRRQRFALMTAASALSSGMRARRVQCLPERTMEHLVSDTAGRLEPGRKM